MHIESGTTKERRTRVLILFLAPLVFTGWFAYDGWIGYPRDNKVRQQAGAGLEHSREDILTQKCMAGGCALAVIAAAVHLVRVLRTRVVLDDQGLRYGRKPVIGWDQMRGLDSQRYEAKGWVALVHQSPSGESRQRLDSYHLAGFEDMVDAICERKGFANPLPEPERRGPGPEPPEEDEDAPTSTATT